VITRRRGSGVLPADPLEQRLGWLQPGVPTRELVAVVGHHPDGGCRGASSWRTPHRPPSSRIATPAETRRTASSRRSRSAARRVSLQGPYCRSCHRSSSQNRLLRSTPGAPLPSQQRADAASVGYLDVTPTGSTGPSRRRSTEPRLTWCPDRGHIVGRVTCSVADRALPRPRLSWGARPRLQAGKDVAFPVGEHLDGRSVPGPVGVIE
jgi:hypothetical protein